MNPISAFLQSQWADIKGNVKFQLLYTVLFCGGGSASVAFAARYFQKLRGAPTQDLLGYIVLAVLCFFALLLVVILARIVLPQGGFDRPAQITPIPISGQLSPESVEEAGTLSVPLPVDLKGEILELYVTRPTSFFPVSKAEIYIYSRIVNVGSSEATITEVGLEIELGDFRKWGSSIRIPANLQVRRHREGVFIGTAFDDFPMEPVLGFSSSPEVYRRGIPHVGWMGFEVYVHGSEEFPNAQFDLVLRDSFGNVHRVRRKAGVFRTEGELVTAS